MRTQPQRNAWEKLLIRLYLPTFVPLQSAEIIIRIEIVGQWTMEEKNVKNNSVYRSVYFHFHLARFICVCLCMAMRSPPSDMH